MKLTKRKGFNFFRSYYDVYNELGDKDKVAFMDALLDRQFLGKKPRSRVNVKSPPNNTYHLVYDAVKIYEFCVLLS